MNEDYMSEGVNKRNIDTLNLVIKNLEQKCFRLEQELTKQNAAISSAIARINHLETSINLMRVSAFGNGSTEVR